MMLNKQLMIDEQNVTKRLAEKKIINISETINQQQVLAPLI